MCRRASIALLLMLSSGLLQAHRWQTLTNPPPTEIGTVLLLTDGTVEADTNRGLATVV
jgi:hypothetical protein